MRGQLFWAAFYASAIGGVAGIVWALALDVSLATALVVGLVVGAVIGATLGWLAHAVVRDVSSRGGDMQTGEGMFVSGSIVALLGMLSIGLGLLVWLIRLMV
jgi:hypothetical protein